MLKDIVHVEDRAVVTLRNSSGEQVYSRELPAERSVVEVHGWVTAIVRERGKIVSTRYGHNVWTNTGREYLAMLMSLQAPGTRYREDSILYVAAGDGSQLEESTVVQMVNAIPYITGDYLAELDVPPTFPLTPLRTTVEYRRVFSESELTLGGSTSEVSISELGLFTDGDPNSNYAPGTRTTTSKTEAPVAYKSFEPITKTGAQQLEVLWEIRF